VCFNFGSFKGIRTLRRRNNITPQEDGNNVVTIVVQGRTTVRI
jgi:hypothetical protein